MYARTIRLCRTCAHLGQLVRFDFHKCEAVVGILTQPDRQRDLCKHYTAKTVEEERETCAKP